MDGSSATCLVTNIVSYTEFDYIDFWEILGIFLFSPF